MKAGIPIKVGKWTYGADLLKILRWNQKATLTIGSFCSISSDVTIMLGCNHDSSLISMYPFPPEMFNEAKINPHNITKGGVHIGNDVWICHGVTILDGITIGDGSVIGANSLVTRDVPPYSIYGGNPANLIRRRVDKEVEELLMETKWWDLDDTTINRILPLIQSSTSLENAKELHRAVAEQRKIYIF